LSPHLGNVNPLHCYLWGLLKAFWYEATLDNEGSLHCCIVDTSQTVWNYPDIPDEMYQRVC
jgi:hypothetical protein